MRIRKYDLKTMQRAVEKPRRRDFPDTQMISQGDIREMLRRKGGKRRAKQKPS